MSNNIKGITIELGGNTGPLSDALKDLNKPINDVQSELKEVNRQLKFDPGNTTLLKQKQDLLAQSADALKEKQAVLKEAVSQAQAQFEKGDLGADKVRAVEREYEKVTSQLKDMQKQETEVEKSSGTLGERIKATFSSMGSSIKSAFTMDNVKTAIGTVGVAVGAFLGRSVTEAGEAESAEKNLEQTLISTKNASGMTAKSLDDLASSLQKSTTFSDDQIKSGESMLLTFTNIGKDVFPQATQALLDMSQKMGTDTSTQAVQLGKALNDPVNGITALTRVGVTFSDSQKSMIKQMVETGNKAGAQKVILDELNKEFGGQASTAAETYSGKQKQLQNDMKDIEENIGSALMPALKKIAEMIEKLVIPIANFIQKHPMLTAALLAVIAVVGTLIGGMSMLSTVLTAVNLTLDAGLLPTMGIVMLAIAAVIAIVAVVVANWTPISNFFKNLWSGIVSTFQAAGAGIGGVIQSIGNFFAQLPGKIWDALVSAYNQLNQWGQQAVNWVISTVPIIIGNIGNFFAQLPGKIWDALVNALNQINRWGQNIENWIGSSLMGIISKIGDAFRELPGLLLQIGKDVVQGLWNGITGAWHTITDGIKNLTSGFISGFKNALGIHSPSTVFASIGGYISQGLANGISSTAGAVTNSLQSLVQNSIGTATKSIMQNNGLQAALDSVTANLKTTIPVGFDSSMQLNKAMSVAYGGDTSSSSGSGRSGTTDATAQAGGAPTFNQYNTYSSPKALSPAEAARQTRNATRQLVLGLRR